MIDPLLALWLTVCAEHYGVEPAFAKAVMLVESGGHCGPLGKGTFIGPFGIHKDFRRKWPIDNPFINVQVGVRALQNTATIEQKKRKLRKYNASFNMDYWNAVMAAYRKGKTP